MSRHAPHARRRAATGPRRGSTRAAPTTFGTDHGCVHVSHNIPAGQHDLIIAAFEVHAKGGFGKRDAKTGMMVSEVETPHGLVILSSDLDVREHFAFYDWEYT